MSGPANYDLEQVMDALADVFNVESGDEYGGVAQVITGYATVAAQVTAPAVVLELDDLSWDLDMGAGADGWTVLATVLVATQETDQAQRLMWRFLSRKPTAGLARLKAALEANKTLGGLVSYAHMTGVRRIGDLTYNGVDYLGAEIVIEVVS